MPSVISDFRLRFFSPLIGQGLMLPLFLFAAWTAPIACAQDSDTAAPAPAPAAQAMDARDDGGLIELDDVQIRGEIAQPNVAISISRAEPQFRDLTLEHVASGGLTELDLSGLRDHVPPAESIRHWKEILNRPRQ